MGTEWEWEFKSLKLEGSGTKNLFPHISTADFNPSKYSSCQLGWLRRVCCRIRYRARLRVPGLRRGSVSACESESVSGGGNYGSILATDASGASCSQRWRCQRDWFCDIKTCTPIRHLLIDIIISIIRRRTLRVWTASTEDIRIDYDANAVIIIWLYLLIKHRPNDRVSNVRWKLIMLASLLIFSVVYRCTVYLSDLYNVSLIILLARYAIQM